MKKLFALLCLVCLALGVFAFAKDKAGKTSTYTGWVSDEKCGAANASADKAACAQKCIEAGQKPVFVSDKDKTVWNVDNPDAIKEHAGHHVQVTGTLNNNVLHVDSVKMADEGGKGKSSSM